VQPLVVPSARVSASKGMVPARPPACPPALAVLAAAVARIAGKLTLGGSCTLLYGNGVDDFSAALALEVAGIFNVGRWPEGACACMRRNAHNLIGSAVPGRRLDGGGHQPRP
jgi:hypothetical protein